ncbi:MAG: amidohydrolase family protein [Rectinemataceae bacterium]
MSGASFLLSGVDVALPDRMARGASLAVSDGRYANLRDHYGNVLFSDGKLSDADLRALPVEEAAGLIAAPRLVEMHIHGAGGCGFESLHSGAELRDVADFLERRGIGCFVPTILWDEGAVSNLIRSIEESDLAPGRIPGIHIEGPFVNSRRKGGIPAHRIAVPDHGLLEKILEVCRGRLKIMTLAPELPGVAGLYVRLREAGVMISLGHSDCTLDTAVLPDAPYSITHLFNAMSGIDHRGSGGLANLPFVDGRSWVEMNADGVHVNAACMRLAGMGIAADRLILTSDATAPAGLPYGEYRYFDRKVRSGADGVRYEDEGTLIGSNKLGGGIISSFIAASGLPPDRAIRAMSANPSAALGLGGGGGEIAVGAPADLFLWTADFATVKRPEGFSRPAAPEAEA